MTIKVRLYAMLRERAGRDWLEVELADGATAADAVDAVAREGGLGELLERLPVRVAVNREYVADDAPVEAGDELALIPPVSGGADGGAATGRGAAGRTAAGRSEDVHAQVRSEPLSLQALAESVVRPRAGAVVSFQGITREVDRLDYEAYGEMATARIAAILGDCVERHRLAAAAAEHRVGSVPLGEPSVIVSVSAAHREEAFAGAREAIDRIKAEAPIWKREVEGEEARWVEGTTPA